VHIHIYLKARLRVCESVIYMYVVLYIYIHVYIHICNHTCVYIYIHIYIKTKLCVGVDTVLYLYVCSIT